MPNFDKSECCETILFESLIKLNLIMDLNKPLSKNNISAPIAVHSLLENITLKILRITFFTI